MSPADVVAADSRLLRRYREHGDLQAREQLVHRMAPLVDAVARPYRSAGEPQELRQVACLGLAQAIERFDPGFGVLFRAYAGPTMSGEVLRHLRDHSRALRPPRRLQTRVPAVRRATECLSGALGHSPTPAQIGEERELLRLLFVEELDQREIAERAGCSQMEVSRTIRQTLARFAAAAGCDV